MKDNEKLILVDVPNSNDLVEAMDYMQIKMKEAGIKLPEKLGYVDWLIEL